jgi:hypothetical protein
MGIYLMYVRDRRSPTPKSETVSRVMSANRAKNTSPELLLRQLLWHSGHRGYRLHPTIRLPSWLEGVATAVLRYEIIQTNKPVREQRCNVTLRPFLRAPVKNLTLKRSIYPKKPMS